MVGDVQKSEWEEVPENFAYEKKDVPERRVHYSSNVPYPRSTKETIGNYTVFGQGVPIKVLRGNNGDFSRKFLNPYKVIIPTVLLGGASYSGNEIY